MKRFIKFLFFCAILAVSSQSCIRASLEKKFVYKVFGPAEDSLIVTDTYVYSPNKGDDRKPLKLDIYYDPTFSDVQGKPVIFYNHGGGWNSYFDRTVCSQGWLRFFAHRGYVCISIDYREGLEYIAKGRYKPESYSLEDCIGYASRMALEDVFDATTFFIGIADKYGADINHIVITGGSAGACNSLNAEYLICNDDPLAKEHLPEGFNYAGVMSLAGALQSEGTDDPEWKRTPCPILFFHGAADPLVQPIKITSGDFLQPLKDAGVVNGRMTKRAFVKEPVNTCFSGPDALVQGLEKIGASYKYVRFEGGDHMINLIPYHTHRDVMFDFIERNVIGGEPIAETVPGNDDGESWNSQWFGSHRNLVLKDYGVKLPKDNKEEHGAFGPVKDSLLVTDTYEYSKRVGDDGQPLKLDIYYDPAFAGVPDKPVILYNHGGGWNSTFDRNTISQVWLRHFAHKGYVCVSVDYREGFEYICNGSVKPESYSLHDCMNYATTIALEDIFDATKFVIKKAGKYGFDPAKMVITGGSAGAVNSVNAEYLICNADKLARKRLPRGFNYAGVMCLSGGLWKEGADEPVWGSKPCPILFVHGTVDEEISEGKDDSQAILSHTVDDGNVPEDVIGKMFAGEPSDFTSYGPLALIPSLEECGASYRYIRYEGGDHMVNVLFCYTGFEQMYDFMENVAFGGKQVQETVPGNTDGEPRNTIWMLEHREVFQKCMEATYGYGECGFGTTTMYAFDKVGQTPAPKGFKPFYISHYGRHGARYCTDDKVYDTVMNALQTAHDAGTLTADGQRMFDEYSAVYPSLKGHGGDLSAQGALQHAMLAQRMVEQFPDVFKGSPDIEASTSPVPRAVVSMASFCASLQKELPKARISQHCYSTETGTLNPVSEHNPYIGIKDIYRILGKSYVLAGRQYSAETISGELLNRLFADPASVVDPEHMQDVSRAFIDVFAHMQCIGRDDLTGLISDNEYKKWWEVSNCVNYEAMGNSESNRGLYPAISAPLLEDFLAKAEEDIQNGIEARLRFGHDMNLFSLLALMEVDSWGGKYASAHEINANWSTSGVPMASNFKIVLYRDKTGEILVKALHNEKECKLPIASDIAPYYKWDDFKSYYNDVVIKAVALLNENKNE